MYVLQRDEEISKLEEKLKWKTEQFQHLEEAHEKLHHDFRSSKAAWENEKSLLLEVIKMNGFNLQSQLKICSQALGNEENMRKLMEAQVSEYKSGFQNISLECHEAKTMIEKLGNKYQDLEQLHDKCRENLKEKEVECKTQIEKARKEMNMNGYLSKMRVQTELELKSQLEAEKQDKEKYFKIIQDKESRIENLIIGFEQEKKSLLQVIEERNQRLEELLEEAKELEQEIIKALMICEEKQSGIDTIQHIFHKLQIEANNLSEKIKVKDESLLQASQKAKQLEALVAWWEFTEDIKTGDKKETKKF